MKNKFSLSVIVILFIVTASFAQTRQEFEGIVYFKHKVVPHNIKFNPEYDYSGIGHSSKFYYKNGIYKWLNDDGMFKMDLFVPAEKRNYLLTENSDTLYWLDNSITDISVVDYRIEKNADTIAGYNCNVLVLKLKPVNKETPVSYRRYYFTDQFYVNPEHFAASKGNCYNLIYQQIQSVPMRIEFEWPNRTVIWEATRVEPKKLDDGFFKIDKKYILKKMM